MRRTKPKHAERLRLIVDTLPYETRTAMIEGLDQFEIIAGAYSDRDGGVCPMLAAHRCGGRTDLRSFARAWDRFTGAGRARRASERELRTLTAQLETSLWREDQARYAHMAEVERLGLAHEPDRHPEPEPAPVLVEPVHEPAPETQPRASDQMGAWLLPVRDLEEYARALCRAMSQIDEPSREPAREEQLEIST